jgi:predicted nucleotidyltransferase component of viral defense system
MKDYIQSVIDAKLNKNDNLNRVREYLQSYFLYVIYRKKFYQNLVFAGGTALRFLYKIRRFSEDLDFSLSARAKDYDFSDMLKDIQQEFKLAGYSLEIKYSHERNVHNAFLKFSGLLFETGLSPLKDEKIAIRVEMDTNPPQGGIETNTLYNSTFMFYMLHYDLASLFAGKVHALLCREYTKGRDWYDLMWYLTKFKEIEPNYIMLNNAMAQTCKNPIQITQENWKTEIKKIVETLDWVKVRDDVARFLEDSSELKLLELETFKNLFNK